MDDLLREFHEKEAKACFNKTWDYIDMEDRTVEDDLNMIHHAHASRFHWGVVGEPIHHERGEWLIAKVYYTLNMAEQSLYHAEACLRICEANDIKDFDIAFAYEAMASANKLLGNDEQLNRFKELAFACLPDIADKEDREYTENELKKI